MRRAYLILSRVLYAFASLALTSISLALIAVAAVDVWEALLAGSSLKPSMLDGIGLVVVALAVFDVAKYLMEEEVLRNRELRSASEARETLTKFLVIIVIAVSLEALVFILGAANESLSLLIYPSILLATAAALVAALALYLRLSSSAEERLPRT
ncbi:MULTISPECIES: hypothetical protein [Thiorhodovibrio]|uniref:hypothetical protein n=1 Tax=Thiorhodovibrio TaxID=61593 RepID=UPI001911D042|nr:MULTISPECIES: hypothetical protein [Thiorhodovibrio]MBK5968396.1 hypothetical protein [Thiorhodovibrio winogradskyi]WPL13317.1 hypothetical protein Thiosp_03116 [Thiorhodovibrio litoralis]